MARDYKERTGLRSGDGEMIHIGDKISEEGAYVAVPVEVLDNVLKGIRISLDTVADFRYYRRALIAVEEDLSPYITKQGGK